MSSSTGSDRARHGAAAPAAAREAWPGTVASLTVVAFSTPWGSGRLALLGDLPFELELPEGAAGAISTGATSTGGSAVGAADEGFSPLPDAATAWIDALARYFAGERVAFHLDVERFCAAHGFTSFETEVYRALAAVPYGETVSYRDLAVAAGRPLAWRAAGSAMALNPLPVILPCHRVVRSDGTLGQYGDDPAWKARLLRHEGVPLRSGGGRPSPDDRLAPNGGVEGRHGDAVRPAASASRTAVGPESRP